MTRCVPKRSRARRPRLAAALVAAAWASGCAIDPAVLQDPRGAPRAPRPPASDDRGGSGEPYDRTLDRAYDDGYSRGWGDREQGRPPAYDRWADAYDAGSESGFRTGYADGYQRRPHRYGAAAPDVTPVAPDWLVGEWGGWDEQEGVEVRLQVRRDGGVTLTGGGRSQSGAYRSGRLELRKGVWRVERVRGGIAIAPEWERGAGVRLERR